MLSGFYRIVGVRGVKAVSYRPSVVEDDTTKTLYFDSLHVQSEMLKTSPLELTLGYTRAMMAFLLFQPEPRDILIVGLGGGSLSKYCHFLLPYARITTVEISGDVIALRDQFCIPADSDRFHVVHADAAEYMKDLVGVADVILLDGFDNFGLPEALGTAGFYADCRRALRPGGVLVANIHGEDADENVFVRRIHQAFAGKLLQVNPLTSFNIVIFALHEVAPFATEVWRKRSVHFRQTTGLPFTRFMIQMWNSARPAADGSDWLRPASAECEIDGRDKEYA